MLHFQPNGIFSILDPEHDDAEAMTLERLAELWPLLNQDQREKTLAVAETYNFSNPPDAPEPAPEPLGLEWRR